MVRNDDFNLNISKRDLYEKLICFKVLFMYFNTCIIYKMVFKSLVTSYQWANFYAHITSQRNHGVKRAT